MKARLEWIKYAGGRNPYSARDVRAALKRIGYEVSNNRMIDSITFEGTKAEIIRQRREVTTQMRIVHRNIAQRFIAEVTLCSNE